MEECSETLSSRMEYAKKNVGHAMWKQWERQFEFSFKLGIIDCLILKLKSVQILNYFIF